VITTVAGSGTATFLGDGGLASKASINSPYGVATDNAGNIYIADSANNRIRKIDSAGVISTVAGCGEATAACIQVGLGDGGPATAPLLLSPWDVVADNAGNFYFTDSGNGRIRKVDASGTISTVAGGAANGLGDGGPAINAHLSNPVGLAIDSGGNLYVAEVDGNRVRKVSAAGIITTIAGSGAPGFSGDGGPAASATLNNPHGVGVDSAGNVYITDTLNARVRKVNTAGMISTIAGNGQVGSTGGGGSATSASFASPWDVKVDGSGNIYVSDWQSYRVRKVDPSGNITTFAGTGVAGFSGDGGPATNATFDGPTGLGLDPAGDLFIADSLGNRIRKVSSSIPAAPTISSNGVVSGASFQPGIVPGSWATIQGTNLASTIDNWSTAIVNGKLPTMLDGVSVTVGTKPGYIYYVSPSQINFVVPDAGPGPTQLTVTTSAGSSAPFNVTSSTYGPAFFPWPGNQAVATRLDFSLAAKNGTFSGVTTTPAKPGDTIILWGTGFGPTNPAAPTGVQIPTDQTYSTSTAPLVTINGVTATVLGAALAPGYAGLYQIAIQVPTTLADGDWPVRATIGGVQSPSGLNLTVQN
jgi:uncharacterized protein (TIGR03437 family)